MTKISVVTAVYNRRETIAQALDSVFSQTHQNVESVVIDGASKLSAIAFDAVGTMFLSDASANVIYSFDSGAEATATLAPSRTLAGVGLSLPSRLAIFEP